MEAIVEGNENRLVHADGAVEGLVAHAHDRNAGSLEFGDLVFAGIERANVGGQKGFLDPGSRRRLARRIDRHGVDGAILQRLARQTGVEFHVIVADFQDVHGALECGAGVPRRRAGEDRAAGKRAPTIHPVGIGSAHTQTHFQREGPEGLHQLIFALLEPDIAPGIVGDFDKGDISAIIAVELACREAAHRSGSAWRGHDGDGNLVHFAVENLRQAHQCPVAGRIDGRGRPPDILGVLGGSRDGPGQCNRSSCKETRKGGRKMMLQHRSSSYRCVQDGRRLPRRDCDPSAAWLWRQTPEGSACGVRR